MKAGISLERFTLGRLTHWIACVLAICVLSGVALAQNQTKVERKTITLGAQNQKSAHGGFVDLRTGQVYSLSDVGPNQGVIDLIYTYGTGTKLNLMMPSSTGLQHFGAAYKAQVFEGWDQKNRGTLLALENNRENRRIFRNISTDQDLADTYEEFLANISDRSDYVKVDHGPAARIKKMEIGDYVFVRSRDRGLLAMGRIVDVEPGFQGHITIDFKVTGGGAVTGGGSVTEGGVPMKDLPANQGDQWQPGQIRFDERKWTEVIVGDMPLVISVPHGGAVHAEEIPDRNCSDVGRVVRGADMRTIETARAIQDAFQKKYNKRPYMVISHLSRRKVDHNREIELATCGDPIAQEAWHYYHSSIDSALAHVVEQFGHTFFVDLHGHAHPNQRLELGYALTKNNLQDAFANRHVEKLAEGSSLNNYLQQHPTITLHELLFGPNAFGTLMYNEGIASTPAMQDPHPVGDEAFFAGGYITRKYTSSDYPSVYGLQIEAQFKGIRDTPSNRRVFAEAFADAITKFSEKFPFNPSQPGGE